MTLRRTRAKTVKPFVRVLYANVSERALREGDYLPAWLLKSDAQTHVCHGERTVRVRITELVPKRRPR